MLVCISRGGSNTPAHRRLSHYPGTHYHVPDVSSHGGYAQCQSELGTTSWQMQLHGFRAVSPVDAHLPR